MKGSGYLFGSVRQVFHTIGLAQPRGIPIASSKWQHMGDRIRKSYYNKVAFIPAAGCIFIELLFRMQ